MGRKILFITTDQQRFDALGCNGGRFARTPTIDGFAAAGVNYTRAHCQSVVCMPSRATMLTGQYVRTHGVWMNGVPLPVDAPSVAAHLHDAGGYCTALIGKAHFEPYFDAELRFYENRMARLGEFGPHRGFDHMDLATHTPQGFTHYARWMRHTYPEEIAAYYPVLNDELRMNEAGGGATGACQVKHNPIPREHYHTDWVADRTIAYLDTLDADADWFVWMSFPDPHHPWDPPQSEVDRVSWREVDLPEGYLEPERARTVLDGKPRHWREWYEGRFVSNYEVPPAFVPAAMTADQVREINALTHVENELIDEACARVLARIAERGWANDTDVLYTTDHGELQGDFGLLFKGPYHVDALMRLPLIWRPAPAAGMQPSVVDRPVGHVDLAPTFCAIAGLPVPDWMQGQSLPVSAAEAEQQQRERVLTEWDSEMGGITMRLRSIYRDGLVCTAYEEGSVYAGTEGELYDLTEDPLQQRNLWDDAGFRTTRTDLVADLYAHLPAAREPRLEAVAPV